MVSYSLPQLRRTRSCLETYPIHRPFKTHVPTQRSQGSNHLIHPETTEFSLPQPPSFDASPWRFGQANPHAILRYIKPISYKARFCPLFLPGCDCMTDGEVYYPVYALEVDQAHAFEYTKSMAYIPRPSTPIQRNMPVLAPLEPPIQAQLMSLPASLTNESVSQLPAGQLSSPNPLTSLDNRPVQVMNEPTSLGDLDIANHAPSNPIIRSHKRRMTTLADDPDGSAPQDSSQPKSKRTKMLRRTYGKDETVLVAHYVRQEIDNGNRTESKWERVSEQLQMHGIFKSKWSIKNWWSRCGRHETGIEERQNPTGRKMVTSKQSPEDRKKARERKKLEVAE
ncbi:MAG: hypothetical protein LQ352_002443 [Teloschistes flavicans]|nr:MAG: hypothetical protein LQ352_002443 [Teloschistes flavicans]